MPVGEYARWLAGHMLIDPDGNEVQPEAELPTHREDTVMIFHQITRAPGDGTSTNGKIEATMRTLVGDKHATPWRNEFYPPAGYKIVPRPGFDPVA